MAVIFIALVSAGLATGGFAHLLNGQPDLMAFFDWLAATTGYPAAILRGGACFLAAASLQWMIVWAWRAWKRGLGLVYLVIGLFFSGLSALSSAGTTLWLGNAAGLLDRKVEAAAAPILSQAEAIDQQAAALQRAAEQLSAQAGLTSSKERADGKTCSNVEGDGDGPITRMRARHAEGLAMIATAGSGMRTDVAAAIRTFRQSSGTVGVGQLSADLAAALTSQTMAEGRRTLDTYVIELSSGWVDVGDDGIPNTDDDEAATCDDPAYLNALSALASDWAELSGQSIMVGERTAPVGISDSYANITEALYAAVSGQRTDALGLSPLLAAFLVELVQVGIVLAAERHAIRSGRTPHPREGRWITPSGRPERLVELEEAVAQTLSDREIRIEGRRMLVLADPPLPEERLAIQLRGLVPERREHVGIPLRMFEQDPSWFDARRHLYGRARAVTLYPLPRGHDSWLCEVMARAHAEKSRPSKTWRKWSGGLGKRQTGAFHAGADGS